MYSFNKIKLNNLDENLYNYFHSNSENTSPFLSLSWLKSISFSSYGYKLKFIEIYENGMIVGYLPCFEKYFGLIKLCSVWGGYGGYVSDKKLALKRIGSFCILKQYSYNKNSIGVKFHITSNKLSTWVKEINLPYQAIFESLHKKTKNQIRKSAKSGLTYVNVDDKELARKCYDVYKGLIDKHNISTPLSINTFTSLAQYDDIDFIAALFDGKVVAYSVFLYSKNECFYWLNASMHKYSALNATNGILSQVIIKNCNSSVNLLNFGAIPVGNHGLEHFKSRWGAVEKRYSSEVGIVL